MTEIKANLDITPTLLIFLTGHIWASCPYVLTNFLVNVQNGLEMTDQPDFLLKGQFVIILLSSYQHRYIP